MDRTEEPRPHRAGERLTIEEITVLKGCNRDSFYYRCLPLGVGLVGITHVLVTRGVLRPHPVYGSKLKCLGAWFVGYLLGKFSYQGECRQRILALKDSPMADFIRQSQRGDHVVDSELYADRPTPSWDRPQQQQQSPPESSVYDDLREQHRQQYQRKNIPPKLPPQQHPNFPNEQTPNFSSEPNFYSQQPPTANYKPSSSSFQPHDAKNNNRVKRNMYGDVIE